MKNLNKLIEKNVKTNLFIQNIIKNYINFSIK